MSHIFYQSQYVLRYRLPTCTQSLLLLMGEPPRLYIELAETHSGAHSSTETHVPLPLRNTVTALYLKGGQQSHSPSHCDSSMKSTKCHPQINTSRWLILRPPIPQRVLLHFVCPSATRAQLTPILLHCASPCLSLAAAYVKRARAFGQWHGRLASYMKLEIVPSGRVITELSIEPPNQ